MDAYGQTISSGDLISKNLYSGTADGPHLHFEIRYYKPADTGNEEFYGLTFTDPSAGPWNYGKWDPNIGYGFGVSLGFPAFCTAQSKTG